MVIARHMGQHLHKCIVCNWRIPSVDLDCVHSNQKIWSLCMNSSLIHMPWQLYCLHVWCIVVSWLWELPMFNIWSLKIVQKIWMPCRFLISQKCQTICLLFILFYLFSSFLCTFWSICNSTYLLLSRVGVVCLLYTLLSKIIYIYIFMSSQRWCQTPFLK